MIRDGEEKLQRILHPGSDGDDDGNFYRRILADRKLVHYGAPERFEAMAVTRAAPIAPDDDDDPMWRRVLMPDRGLVFFGPPGV